MEERGAASGKNYDLNARYKNDHQGASNLPARTRQVSFFHGKVVESHTDRMKHKIDCDPGKRMITRRFATVEPVFGNLRNNKRLDRLILCSQITSDGQKWPF